MSKIKAVKLVDLIEIDELQQLQDVFAFSYDVSSVISDTKGNNITQNSNFSNVCRLVGSTEKGAEKCALSNKCLGQRVAKSMKPELMYCLSCGFLESSAPIIIGGTHVATWHISHKAIGIERAKLIQYALEIDLNPNELSSAYKGYEGITEQKFKQITELLWLIANQISSRSYAAFKAERALKEQLRLHKALCARRNRLRQLASEFLITEEKTKRTIAMELHDTVGHSLVSLKRNLHVYAKHFPDDDLIKKDIIAVENIIEQTRGLTFRLSTPILYDFGIAMALESLADDIFRPIGIKFTLTDHCPDLKVKENYRVLLYRMLSELCYNIIKHANATEVDIAFCMRAKSLIVTVTDNGGGFYYDQKNADKKKGLGLFGIRERLHYYGGTMKILSKIGEGTCITISLPVVDEENKQ